MIEVAELFSVDKTTAESELKEILEFERKLANVIQFNSFFEKQKFTTKK